MKLTDYFWLKRANRYTNYKNSNDRLPVVYGDLTDGTSGNWILPCIDTVNHVYAFAGHEVLSVAAGNAISIYAEDTLVNPANYTFDESNNYESEGLIATVIFTADQANAKISARGKGKAAAGVLIENIIDIIDDLLTVECDFSPTLYDATSKARASQLFTGQAYKAAGVIDKDINLWTLLQQMMGSFLGSIYLNADKLLTYYIDDGTLSMFGEAAIIPKSDIRVVSATQKTSNLVNQCPASYGYNYAAGEFRHHVNDSAYADAISQGIYGVQEPTSPYQLYWCRDTTSVHAIQTILVAKLKNPLWEVEIEDLSLKRANVDVMDLVAATIDCVYDTQGREYLNQWFRVVSCKPDYPKNKVNLRLQDTRFFRMVAYLADGSHLADGSIRAGGDRDVTAY